MHDRLRDAILTNASFVCWPTWGSGNALCRLLVAHDEFLYNSLWNGWGVGLQSTLETPDQFNACGGKYSTAHYASPGITRRWDDCTLEESLDQSLTSFFTSHAHKRWLKRSLAEQRHILLPVFTHNTAYEIVDTFARPAIQLCFRDYETVFRRQQHALINSPKYADFVKQETLQFHIDKQTPHPLICNLVVEDLFFGTYNTFLKQYELMCQHVKIQPLKPEACWAFSLYYRDRVVRGTQLDTEHTNA